MGRGWYSSIRSRRERSRASRRGKVQGTAGGRLEKRRRRGLWTGDRSEGEAGEEERDELASGDEAVEVDPLVGRVGGAAKDAEGVDGGKPGGLEVVSVADAAGGGEGEMLSEVFGSLTGEAGESLDLGGGGLGRAGETRSELDRGEG